MAENHFDYIIVGNGLAGLKLALALSEDSFFNTKKIGLIDKVKKNENDKTWCFWEKGAGRWDEIVHRSWSDGSFYSSKNSLSFELYPYEYKMIHSIDFYEYSFKQLNKKKNFSFIYDEITSFEELDVIKVKGLKHTYTCEKLFDSRIPTEYYSQEEQYIRIYQHFKGWFIETKTDVFDPANFTMMDYRLKYQDDTTFTYVLPLSKRKALVEFTFFTPYTVESNVYDIYLGKYIDSVLKIKEFEIIDEEYGVIPMTDFPFEKYNSKAVTKIGTGGGWVKGSTGYSFKNSDNKISILIDNLKNNNLPSKGFFKKRYQFYDKVFLHVLKNNNKKGEWIFDKFYSRNSITNMFSFLNEETSFLRELKIMSSLLSITFLKSFFKSL